MSGETIAEYPTFWFCSLFILHPYARRVLSLQDEKMMFTVALHAACKTPGTLSALPTIYGSCQKLANVSLVLQSQC